MYRVKYGAKITNQKCPAKGTLQIYLQLCLNSNDMMMSACQSIGGNRYLQHILLSLQSIVICR